MKHLTPILLLICAVLFLFPGISPGLAKEDGMLQVNSLRGRFLSPRGLELGEYDYLESGWKCRLMPGAEVELITLDGRKTYRVVGPGVVEFDGAETVTLNGKPIVGSIDPMEAPQAKAGAVQGNKLAGLPMRSGEKIKVKARTATGGTRELPLYSGYHALVIGVGDYNRGWPSLRNPIQDAREVSRLLKSQGWQVEMVENPDWERLRDSLNALITGPGRDQEKAILVWFSGHGHTLEEADGSKLGYIVPTDAPDPGLDEMGFMNKAVSMRQVETVARRIRSKHVLMVFDSCFSGAIFRITRAAPPPFIEEKVGQPVRQFITAGNENEQVPDKSFFKTVFLQGLGEGYADRNRDGYITGQELGAYLQENVINYSRKAQHPLFGKINNPKLDKGDFVFVKQAISPGKQVPRQAEKKVVSAGGSKPAVVTDKEPSGSVEVTGNVDRVKFRLDGTWFRTKQGKALVIGQVPVGEHEILAQKEGYQDWRGKVRVKAESTTTLEIRMEKAVAKAGGESGKTAETGAQVAAKADAPKSDLEKVVMEYRTRSKTAMGSYEMMMVLTFQDNMVTGVYDDNYGKIEGKLEDRYMVGTYENERNRPTGYYPNGIVRFKFSKDMKSFWGSIEVPGFGGKWAGFDGRIVE